MYRVYPIDFQLRPGYPLKKEVPDKAKPPVRAGRKAAGLIRKGETAELPKEVRNLGMLGLSH